MISGAEAVRSLYGAYRLARLDPRGLEFLDATPEGALRSFWAAAIVLPLHVLLLTLRPETGASPIRLVLVGAVAYVILWTAYPVLMIHVCTLIDRQARYPGFVAAYNWTTAIIYFVQLPIVLMVNLAPSEPLMLVHLGVAIMLLAYQWFVTRTALGIGTGMAVGLVIADLILGLFVQHVTDGMLQAGASAAGG